MATLKTTTLPLDQLLLSEYRTTFADVWLGVAYANMDTNEQTELNRMINEAHEYISQRAAHHPWGIREQTSQTVSAGTDTVYEMPADFRHVISIKETGTNATWSGRVTFSDKDEWYKAEQDTHPWVSRTVPIWFFDGMTAAAPPVQQWRRIGKDNTGAEIHILYRPYFSLLTTTADNDRYTQLPAAEVKAIKHEFMHQWKLFEGEFEAAGHYRSAREDAIAALETNDRVTNEDPYRQGFDSEFSRQLG
jgi:hypothetical protein